MNVSQRYFYEIGDELKQSDEALDCIPHATLEADPRTRNLMREAHGRATELRRLLEFIQKIEEPHYRRLTDDNGNRRVASLHLSSNGVVGCPLASRVTG